MSDRDTRGCAEGAARKPARLTRGHRSCDDEGMCKFYMKHTDLPDNVAAVDADGNVWITCPVDQIALAGCFDHSAWPEFEGPYHVLAEDLSEERFKQILRRRSRRTQLQVVMGRKWTSRLDPELGVERIDGEFGLRRLAS